MALNNVLTFVITPTEPIQMILGTNGCGKSSLIAELTPLPAEQSAYLPTGSKTIEITHRGSFYLLISDFSVSKVHSFNKDGEELNPGGGVTTQRELVKQEFGITPEIHEMLTGLEHFHSMSPSRRREWFTRLSDVSYDYALQVFKKLAEKSRDLSGAVKLARKRLVSESAKVISTAEEEKLQHDVEVTLRELNILLEQRAPLDRTVHEVHGDRQSGFDELTRLSRKLLNMRFSAPYGTHPYGRDERQGEIRDDWGQVTRPGFTSLAEIDHFIDGIRHRITERETILNHQVSEHEKVEETLRVLKRTGEAGIAALLEQRTAKADQRMQVLQRRTLGIEGLDPLNAQGALASVRDNLTAVFQVLPENADRRFSTARLQELMQGVHDLKRKREEKTAVLTKLNAEKAHAETHKANGKLTCPNCSYVWIAGYSEQKFETLLALIATTEDEAKALDEKISQGELDIETTREYGRLWGDYTRCVRSWPVLTPFWNYLAEQEVVTRSPRKALVLVQEFQLDLEYEVAAKRLDDEMSELNSLIRDAEQVGDASMVETQNKLDELTLRIEAHTAEIGKLRQQLSDYATWRRQLAEAEELSERIRNLSIMQEKLNDELIEAIRRDTLNHCVRQLQHSLAIKQNTLNDAVAQRKIVTELEAYINELALKEEAGRLAVRELSPTDGLIAEGLFGFIRNYTGQMNNLIRKIWSYPLQVMDCGMSHSGGAELDYKFPLMVQTKDNVVADVKLGSEGMREIVDLAFRVVAMRFLGLTESPLYLDEFGRAFDETHRNSATGIIKNMMETQPFTQLFMVSHYESSYGAFTNAQVCVIDKTNITVPGTAQYNQHVVIE
jgi:hypothetical protein